MVTESPLLHTIQRPTPPAPIMSRTASPRPLRHEHPRTNPGTNVGRKAAYGVENLPNTCAAVEFNTPTQADTSGRSLKFPKPEVRFEPEARLHERRWPRGRPMAIVI